MIEIIVAVIGFSATILSVVISTIVSDRKRDNEMDKRQAVTDTKLEELTREVREHNNFARRMPVVEEKIEHIEKRLDNLERKE